MNKKEITLLVAVPLVSISILSLKEINVQAQESNTNSQALERPASSIIAMYPIAAPSATTPNNQVSKEDPNPGSSIIAMYPVTLASSATSDSQSSTAPLITDTPDAHNTGDFAEGSTVETNSGEQGTDSSTSPTDTMYPETATPAPTEPDDNTIVHLIDAISGKEVGTVTMGQWLEAFKADYNGVVLPGGYRNANWRSDAQGGPELSRTQSPDYEYPVISTAEYENEINHATVVVHYIDEETNTEVGTWTYLVGGQVGYLPGDYKNLPFFYRVDTNKAEENSKLDNGQISRKVYLLKMQANATPYPVPNSQSSEASSSASQSSSSAASSSISGSLMASSAQASTTTSASSSAVTTTSQSSTSNSSKAVSQVSSSATSTAKALPTTADNAKESFTIMLIGLLLSVFSYIFYQMRKRIFK